MVTSNKQPDKKVVKMGEQNSVVVPQRTQLGEVNEHLTCPLCHGYYIDATTIVECLHSFCRSCIIKHLQVKSYCPVCEMMINSAKPNIKLDKALQDIVYKLVPGLFQKEMEKRQQFYSSRPGTAASATPEQRGEDTERIIFSPEDVISFSLEYADVTDNDSVSSKSSDSNETQPLLVASRRYLQCPAVVNISHLKKFISMKFDIDSSRFTIDILYKRMPLPDYYTLMDIAYIYNWKRNEPMHFFYQIIDYVAIRNRLFDTKQKDDEMRNSKRSPDTEDINVNPTPNINVHGSKDSVVESPVPDDKHPKQLNVSKKSEKSVDQSKEITDDNDETSHNSTTCSSTCNKNNEDVEKSQFLISFELTAKSNSPSKSSSTETNTENTATPPTPNAPAKKTTDPTHKLEDPLKRKYLPPPDVPQIKKIKIELEKAKIPDSTMCVFNQSQQSKKEQMPEKRKEYEKIQNTSETLSQPSKMGSSLVDQKPQTTLTPNQVSNPDSPGTKRPLTTPPNIVSPKSKTNIETALAALTLPNAPKTGFPTSLKQQVSKSEAQSFTSKATESTKHTSKKIPDLKPSILPSLSSVNKGQITNKIRMDLLANHSDPTIDRSKIMSQVKSSLSIPNSGPTSGDPLKTLFDSCKINIPSSLSITLTDQKQDPRNPGETSNPEVKKPVVNKHVSATGGDITHKTPNPPVHNYIEILKLSDSDPKAHSKTEGNIDNKPIAPNKTESMGSQSKPVKSFETSAKGPVPNLKPIADTKVSKQGGHLTFQQSFEQQFLQSDNKPKLPKTKAQLPKLMPATPRTLSAASKLNNPNNKSNPSGMLSDLESKPSTALDLTTPSEVPQQSQLGPHQTKAFETMQSIANLVKKQNLQPKLSPAAMSHSFSNVSNRPHNTAVSQKLPSMPNINQFKPDKANVSGLVSSAIAQRQSNSMKPSINSPNMPSSNYQIPSYNSSSAAPSPSSRSHTRSPSSSPKLVIAEEKNSSNPESKNHPSSQMSSCQISKFNIAPKAESSKSSIGPTKSGMKHLKPVPYASKIGNIRQSMMPTVKPNPPPSPTEFQLLSAHHAMLKHQIEMNWLKARQYMAEAQSQNGINKDK